MSRDHEKNEQPDELAAIEQSLRGVAPVPARLDRDRLMFLAGAASAGVLKPAPEVALARRSRFLWPATTGAFAATSLALAMALIFRPTPPPQIVYLKPEIPLATPAAVPHEMSPLEIIPEMTARVPPPAPAARVANNYLQTREVALRFGVDALGNRQGATDAVPLTTYGDWLESVLPPPAVSRSSSSPFPSM
jgi:hypothetical protein